MKKIILILLFLAAGCAGNPKTKVSVLVLNGLSTHKWKETTKDNIEALMQTDRFIVDVSQSPGKKDPLSDWEKWLPDFSKYDVVISHINDRGKTRFSKAFQKSLETYIRNGGGFVVVHSANNSSYDWPMYNRMIAVGGWGGRKAGTAGFLLRKKGGSWCAGTENEGISGGHGPQREFLITIDKPEHPITQDMPLEWMHSKDELYHSLRGPAKEVKVIASAYCSETGVNEPMAMVIQLGKGKIFHTPMGHYNEVSTKCLGFQALLVRGTEYAATGTVTIGLPQDFPTKYKAVHKNPKEVIWQ